MVIIKDYHKSLYSGSIEDIKSPLRPLLFFVFAAGGGGGGEGENISHGFTKLSKMLRGTKLGPTEDTRLWKLTNEQGYILLGQR